MQQEHSGDKMVVKNKNRGFRLFAAPSETGFGDISLIGSANGLVSGRATGQGFTDVIRAGQRIKRGTSLVAGGVRTRVKRFKESRKKPSTQEVLGMERKAILKKLRVKAMARAEEKEIMRLEFAPLREIIPKAKKKKGKI